MKKIVTTIINKAPSVLVLGEDTRSFLSVIRSLGEAGYEVHVVCYDKKSSSLKSKYIRSAQYYNYQALTQDEWLSNVIALIERYQFDLIVPCDERAIYPLWSAKQDLPEHTQLAIGNQEVLDALFDKWETKQLAIACNVPAAHGEKADLSKTSYDEIKQTFGKQFVIKPLQSFEESNLNQRQKVAIIHCEKDYLDYQKSVLPEQLYLIEAFFIGKGEGLSVFAVDGEVYAAFAHVRVAEPIQGGGSSYRKSVPLDDELLKATEAICSRTKLTGVAMFEYRRNLQTKQWILVEVNARFWGSLPLAIYAGIDFPALYADYLVKGHLPKPLKEYRIPVFARSFISDIYEMKREYETGCSEGNRSQALNSLVKRLVQLVKVASPYETIDSLNLRDSRPFFNELGMLAGLVSGSVQRKIPIMAKLRRNKVRSTLLKLFKINKNRRFITVCYGNIMRSPFAEQCIRQISQENEHGLTILSFGFHLQEDRQSPEKAQEAAHNLKFDLSDHRSKWLTQLDLKDSDIVIYFDEKNRDKLTSYYKVQHAFNAADILDSDFPELTEIEDPYGGDLSRVTGCYLQIKNSMNNLLTIYKEADQ